MNATLCTSLLISHSSWNDAMLTLNQHKKGATLLNLQWAAPNRMNTTSPGHLKKAVINASDLGRGVVWNLTVFLISPSKPPVSFLDQQFALVLEHTHLAMCSQQKLINIYMTLLVRFAALLCVWVWFDFHELWFVPLPMYSLQLCCTGREQDSSVQHRAGASTYPLFKSPMQQGPS